MNSKINNLCKDPLFQLNFAIWLSQPQSSECYYVYPLFYESGMRIHSIPKELPLPPDIRLIISENKYDCQEGAKPDLILETAIIPKKYCLIECKASSFGLDLKNQHPIRQAKALLLITGPIISEVLALGQRGENKGSLCYFIGPNNCELMENTLESLSKEIVNKLNLKSGIYGCFSIKPSETSIQLVYSEKIKNVLNLTKSSPVDIIQFEQDTDPRPLYLIPYDPNIDQSRDEQELCRRIIFERILSHVISKLGGTEIPASVIFSTEELLNSATFGLYEIWEDSDATKHIKKIVRDFLQNIITTINDSYKKCVQYKSGEGWIFNLQDQKTYEELLKQITKFKPETIDLSKQVEPNLFDE